MACCYSFSYPEAKVKIIQVAYSRVHNELKSQYLSLHAEFF